MYPSTNGALFSGYRLCSAISRMACVSWCCELLVRCIQTVGVQHGDVTHVHQDDIQSLGQVVLEQAWAYYQSEAARLIQKHSQMPYSGPETNTWVAFKVSEQALVGIVFTSVSKRSEFCIKLLQCWAIRLPVPVVTGHCTGMKYWHLLIQ